MSLPNNTVSEIFKRCPFTGTIQWRDEYLTPSVYINLIIISVVNGLSFPFTALLNAVFILGILFKQNLRGKKSTVLTGYLAVTDLVVGVIVQPIFLASVLCRITGRCNGCAVDSARVYLLRVSCKSPLVHVTLVAWERYMAIKHALQYKLVVTTKRLLAGTIAAWLTSVASICITFFHVTLSKLLTTIGFLISIAVTVYFYIAIYLESRRHRREIQANNPRETNLLREKNFKAAKTTAIIFGCLLICNGPSFSAIIIDKFIVPFNQPNAPVWACIFPWMSTFIMLNSLCNPCIYGWRVKEFRDVIASVFQIFKCCSTGDTRQSEIEMIEKVELNTVGRLTNGSLADRHESRRKMPVDSNDEASQHRNCGCKTEIPFTGIRNNVDSANDLELNDLSSKANSSKSEQNRLNVEAMVHMQPKLNLRQPEVLVEDADTLSAEVAKEMPCKATATESAASCKSRGDIEKSGEAIAELEERKTQQEMNDNVPCLAAVIDKIEEE